MDFYVPNTLFLMLGIIIIGVGLLVWSTKSASMLEAHEDDKNYNEGNLLRYIVGVFVLAGFIITISAALAMVYSFINSAIIFGIVVIIMALMIGIGCKKYEV